MDAQELPQLWEHQKKFVELQRGKREFALFAEMGTGKTAAVITAYREKCAEEKRVLKAIVLAPVVTLQNWKREFEKYSRVGKYALVLSGPTAKRCSDVERFVIKNAGAAILITNYEALVSKEFFKTLLAFWPDVLICDESHRLKNHAAERTKRTTQLADRSKYKFILSGSPILNSGMDIYAQYRVLDGGSTFGDSFYRFRNRYFYDKNAGMPGLKYFPDWRPLESSYKEFNTLIYRKAFRVLKKDCLDLPPLLRKRMDVGMGKEQHRMYHEMKKHFISYLGDKTVVATIALTKLLRLQQIASGFFKADDGNITHYADNPRLKALSEILEDILAGEAKVIVWASFIENYAMIEKVLPAGVGAVKLVGGMTDKARQESIDRFQADPQVRVMVSNQAAGGIGVNLTAASFMVYFSKGFSLEADIQSEARAHRGGSEIHDKITRIDLVAPDSVDEVITNALWAKVDISESILKMRERFL